MLYLLIILGTITKLLSTTAFYLIIAFFIIFIIMNIYRYYTSRLKISAADENFFNSGWKGWQYAIIHFDNFDIIKDHIHLGYIYG